MVWQQTFNLYELRVRLPPVPLFESSNLDTHQINRGNMKAVNSIIIISTLMGVIQGCGTKAKEEAVGCKDSVYILAPKTRTEQYTCSPGQDISVPSLNQVMCICRKEHTVSPATVTVPSSASVDPPVAPEPSVTVAPVEAPVVDSQPSP